MKLSKECIEAIEVHEECYYQDYGANRNTKIRSTFMVGATEALTNPSIYSKAGLISLEELNLFSAWVRDNCEIIGGEYFINCQIIEASNLYQIYKQSK